MYDALIFDWSGTLGDDLDLVIDATNHVFKKFQKPVISKKEFQTEFCLPYLNFYQKFIPHIPQKEIDKIFYEGFRFSKEKVSLLEGAEELLQFIQEKKMQLFMLTSVNEELLFPQLLELKVEKYFDKIYAGVIDKCDKIPQIIAEQNLEGKRVAFVGDMQHDIEAAKTVNIDSIALSGGYTSEKNLLESNPDFLFPDLKSFFHLLQSY